MDVKAVRKYIINFDTDDADKKRKIIQFIDQQAKYAELGRLAIECGNPCSGAYEKSCPRVCDKYYFCQKRAELLAGENND